MAKEDFERYYRKIYNIELTYLCQDIVERYVVQPKGTMVHILWERDGTPTNKNWPNVMEMAKKINKNNNGKIKPEFEKLYPIYLDEILPLLS